MKVKPLKGARNQHMRNAICVGIVTKNWTRAELERAKGTWVLLFKEFEGRAQRSLEGYGKKGEGSGD